MKLVLKILAGLVGLIVVAGGGAFAYVMTIDLNDWKPEIQDQVREATGRLLVIQGPIDFELGSQTTFKTSDISLSNAQWGSRPNMVEIGSVDVEIDLFSLLGTPDITRVHINGVRAIVETNPDGLSNADFSGDAAAAGTSTDDGGKDGADGGDTSGGGGGDLVLPILRDVQIADVELVQKDGATGEEIVFTLNELTLGATSEADPMMLNLDALLVAAAAPDPLGILLVGEMGSVQSMTDSDMVTPVDFTGNIAGIDLSITGQIADLAGQEGIDITLSAFGDELAEAAKVVGIDVPSLGGFKVDATLAGSGDALSVNPLSIDIGTEDIIRAVVAGTIDNAMSQEGIELVVSVDSTQIGNLSPVAQAFSGQDVPALGPLDVDLEIVGGMEDGISANGLSVTLGTEEMLALSVTGQIEDLLRQSGIELTLSAASPELGNLSDIAKQISGQAVPNIGPMAFGAEVSGAVSDGLSLEDLAFSMGKAETVSIEASGEISDLVKASGADIGFKIVSPDLSALSGLVGSEVPSIGPVDVSGSVKGAAGEPIALEDFNAVIGSSDLSGTARFDATGAVPKLSADFKSDRFDLNDVTGGGSGARSGGGGSATASGGSAGSGAGASGDGKVIPADPLPFAALRGIDAEISYTAGMFVAAVAELTDFDISIELEGGELDVGPFSAGVGTGKLEGSIALDGSKDVAPLSIDIEGEKLGLESLLAGAGFRDRIEGPLDLTIDLEGSGNSPRAIAASLDGEIVASTYDSRILKQAIEESAGSLIADMLSSQGGWVVLDCAVFDYVAAKGVLDTKAGYVASGGVSVVTEGQIDLTTEELALDVKPAGGGGFASVPLIVTGTLANPSVIPDPVSIGVGVLAGVLTGGLAPALLAVVGDFPDGHPCKASAEATQSQAEAAQSQPAAPSVVEQAVENPAKAIQEGIGGALNNLFGN